MLKTNLTIEEFLPNITDAQQNKWENISIRKDFYEGFEKSYYCETIKEYWETFTEPRLPDKDVVLAWHKMLMEYCKMPGAFFAVRDGSSAGKLRRGWLTKTNDDYSYFFADNDFACIIFKMVLQGYCPDVNDFYKAMTEFKYINEITWCKNSRMTINDEAPNGKKRKFTSIPQHFQKYGGERKDDDKTEDWYNAILIKSPNPSFGIHGYKHSHLYSTGKKYILNGNEISMKANFNGLFPIGDISDWQWSDECDNYIRFQNIPDERKADSKAMAIASFLRFIDPLNHFLSPKSKKKGNVYNQYKKTDGSMGYDIAECDELLQYAQEKMRERYGTDVYEEFGKLALIKKFKPANGDLVIEITFSTEPFEDNIPSKNTTVTPKSTTIIKNIPVTPKNTTVIENNAVSNYTQKIGAAAKKLFISLLEEDKLSPAMITNLRDRQYCRNQEINYYAVLAIDGEDSIEQVRYYKDLICGKYYLSSQWFEKHRDKLVRWLSDNDLEDKVDLLYTQIEDITVPTKNTTNAVNTTIDKDIAVSNYTLKIGAAAKKLFISLLEEDILSPSMIANLRDKRYCSSEIGSSFPVLVVKGEDSFDDIRYYKNLLCGKYYLSSQWYEKHRDRLISWLSDNGFEDKISLLE